MSDPARAMERATDFNAKLFGATMRSWQEATNRFWGLETPQEEEEGRPDKRFSAPDWEQNPYYETLKESYLLASEYLLEEAEGTNGEDTAEQRRLKFHLKQFVDAMAPVNYLLTNPAALKRAFETGGVSLAEGARNLLTDLQEGRMSMTDANAFQPGENLAITPGKVVYRNELIELIQYEPTTEQVYDTPVMFIPPWINKYYILDLQPKNSFVKYLVDEGYTVFMISWKNPDASMEDIQFEEYMTKGPLAAAEAVRDITGSDTVNPVGYCVGGTLLAIALSWLSAGGDENPFGPPTFMVALHDFTEVGDTGVFIDEPQIEFMEQQMLERGYLDNRKMANMFNLLRSNDLIWSNVVNNYLLGQKPPGLRPPVLELRRHAHGPRRPQLLPAQHLPREQPHRAWQGRDKGPPDRPLQDRGRHLRRRRREGPHRALGLGVEDLQARQRQDALHPRQLGPHSGHDQPSIQGQGPLLGDRERRRLRHLLRLARERQGARRLLVGGLEQVARTPLRR